MKKMFAAALAVSALAVAPAAFAAGPCQGKVVIDTVYQKGTNGKFDYYVQYRNASNAAITSSLEIAGFPSTVSVFSRSLPGITLKAYENKQIKFASGSNDQINDGTVSKFYDTKGGGTKPYVLATGCKA